MHLGSGHIGGRRIGGVDVRVDWSWPIVVLAFFLALSASLFATHPDWSIGLSMGIALIATAGLAASLVLRDALSVLAAQRLGTPITAVTMGLAGGVPVYARERRSAVREAVLAAGGPLFHAALGVALLAIAGLVAVPVSKLFLDPAGVLRTLPPGATAIAWVGLANLAIAALDALPAFPLSGGRVLRSILWEATSDHALATRVAARAGQGVAVVLLIAGLASAFRLGPRTVAEGVWLTLIGWMLLHAATSAIRTAALDQQMGGVMVRELMRPVVRMITADAPLITAAVQHFVGTSSRALPVMHREGCVGVLRFEDLRKIAPREWADRPVADAMVPLASLPKITPESDIAEALRTMIAQDAMVAPVLDGHDVVGVIEVADVVRWLDVAEVAPKYGPEPEESMGLGDVLLGRRRATL